MRSSIGASEMSRPRPTALEDVREDSRFAHLRLPRRRKQRQGMGADELA